MPQRECATDGGVISVRVGLSLSVCLIASTENHTLSFACVVSRRKRRVLVWRDQKVLRGRIQGLICV